MNEHINDGGEKNDCIFQLVGTIFQSNLIHNSDIDFGFGAIATNAIEFEIQILPLDLTHDSTPSKPKKV